VNPLVAILLGWRGITIERVPEGEPMPELDTATRR
jgi:hypothetical protein